MEIITLSLLLKAIISSFHKRDKHDDRAIVWRVRNRSSIQTRVLKSCIVMYVFKIHASFMKIIYY
jgi:hypothetical protein